MKAVIQVYKTGELSVAESPAPQLRDGWVLVRNAHSLISAGTEKTKVDTARKSLVGKALARPDLVKKVIAKAAREGLSKAWRAASDRLDQPEALGYSCAGQVIETAGDVESLRTGDWVACGGSTANHAEIVCVPKNLAVPIPEGVGTDGAAFATVGAIAMQGVRQTEAQLGEQVAVIGLGLVGLLTVQILRASGCRVFGVDVDPEKLLLAKILGCDGTASAGDDTLLEQILAFTGGYGVDSTIITAATPSNTPVEQAAEVTREKGKVVVVGLTGMTIPREPFYHKELDLRLSRSYGPGRYDRTYEEGGIDYPYAYVRFTEGRNMLCFLQLLQANRVQLERIITHRFPIHQAVDAYNLLHGKAKEPYLGILLEYPIEPHAIDGGHLTGRATVIPSIATTKTRPNRDGSGLPPVEDAEQRRSRPVNHASQGNRRAITIGVIGAGNYACAYLLPHLKRSSKMSLGGVCTVSGISAVRVAKKFGFAAAYEDTARIIDESDAVLIATRHCDHADGVIKALSAGKAVFVEKPLVLSESQLDQVISAASNPSSLCIADSGDEESSSSVTVGFNRRFAPATRLVQKHFEPVKGPKQVMIRVNAGSIPHDHWVHDPKVGGGRLIGEGCHFVDLAVCLTASLVKRVSASAIPKPGLSPDLWDDFSMVLEMTDGSIATIVYTSIGDSAMSKERIEIAGGGRSALIDDFRTVELWVDGRAVRKRFWSQDKGQAAQIEAWVDSLGQGSSPIPFGQIISVHRACFAAIGCIKGAGPVPVKSLAPVLTEINHKTAGAQDSSVSMQLEVLNSPHPSPLPEGEGAPRPRA